MGKIFFGFSQLPPTQNPAILIVQPRHHLMDFQNQKQKQNTPFTSETSTPPIATPRTALESRQGVRSNKLKRGRPKSYKYPNTLYVWCHTSRCTLMSNNSTPLVVQRRRCTWILRCSLLVHIDSKRHVCPIALPKKRNEKRILNPQTIPRRACLPIPDNGQSSDEIHPFLGMIEPQRRVPTAI